MMLSRIFRKKKKPPQAEALPKRLSLSDARLLLFERLEADEASALERCYGVRERLVNEVAGLKSAIAALASADVPEPAATASKAIKDGFAQRAMAALVRVEIPFFDSIGDARIALLQLQRALSSISAGPREAMHVGFFFEQQMADIAARLKLVFGAIADGQRLTAPSADRRERLEKTLCDIDAFVRAIQHKRDKAAQAESDARDARAAMGRVQLHDLAELHRLRGELAQLEQTADALDSRIASMLSPALRLLKRFGHASPEKRVVEFVRRFEAAPAAAFWDDEPFLKSVLGNAVAAARSGRLSADGKEVGRAEDALGRLDDLNVLRDRKSAILLQADKIRAAIEREVAKERENDAASARIKALEEAVAVAEARIAGLKHEISENECVLSRSKQELEALAAELGERIEIVP